MLLHADNFNYYSTDKSLLLDGVYAEADTYVTIEDDPDGLSPDRVLRIASSSSDQELRYVLPAAVPTVGVAFRLWMPSLPDGPTATNGMIFKDAGNDSIVCLWVETTGALKVSLNDSIQNVIAESAGPVITAAGWYHIEIKFTPSPTVAEVEVRVEGATVIQSTGLTTEVGPVAQFSLASICNGSAPGIKPGYFKDLVVWDTSGPQDNDFFGPVLAYELIPIADVTLGGWNTTGANGFSVLDNNPPQDGAEYISADDTPPAAAQFELSKLPDDITSVKGLVTRVRATKSDGGDGRLQVSLVSGVSEDNGADRPITVAETYWSDVSELDPATGSAWTPGSVNAVVLKLDRTL